jgi:hypothetical protein
MCYNSIIVHHYVILCVTKNLIFASFDSHCQDFKVAVALGVWSLQFVRNETKTHRWKWCTYDVNSFLLLGCHDVGVSLFNLRWIGRLSFLLHLSSVYLRMMFLWRHLLPHVTLRHILTLVIIIFILWRCFSNSKVLTHTRLQNCNRLTLLQCGFKLNLSRDALKVFLLRLGCLNYRQVQFRVSVHELLRCFDILI